MKVAACLILAGILASGCAPKAMYAWGPYEDGLYQSYKDPSKSDEFLTGLQGHVEAARTSGEKVPPGIYAEIGTLYLDRGNAAKAIEFYRLEATEWPESSKLMNALEQSLQTQEAKLGD